ncbi:hypothetical protein [Nocardioides sp.]|uniref:hypothetical protein n=1 Tax=Nocardioides sp. TaxID=35761 RepID=UPI0035287A13
MRRTASLTALLTTTALALGPMVGPARAEDTTARQAVSTVTVRLGTLPTGSHARTTYLIGRDLHLADGTVRHLPFTKAQARDLVLAGRAGGGWVIGGPAMPSRDFVLVKGKKKTVVHRGFSDDDTDSWRLSREGTRLLVSYLDRGDDTEFFVNRLDGTRVVYKYVPGPSRMLEFAAGTVTFSVGAKTKQWSKAEGMSTLTRRPSALADQPHDLLFVRGDHAGEFGPTTLTAPDTPTWTASFLPVALSPDGTLVAGYQRKGGWTTHRIDVRRVSDGERIASYQPGISATLRWEDDGALLWTDYLRGWTSKHALVRCTIGKKCQRVTSLVKSRPFGFPSP